MRRTRPVALALCLASIGCHTGAPETTPRAPELSQDETVAAEEADMEDEPAPDEPVAVRAPGDLLRCELDVQALALGAAGDGVPSAPVALGEGFVVAFTRTSASGSELLVQTVSAERTLGEPRVIASGVHYGRPFLIGDGQDVRALAIRQSGVSAIRLDASGAPGEPVPVDRYPADAAIGPRGLVTVHTDERRRVLRREGHADVRFPAPRSTSEPREQILASGPEAELVLTRQGRAARLTAVSGDATSRSGVLFRDGQRTWAEASVAAGTDGFVLVRTGPEIGELEVYLCDSNGTPGEAVAIPAPQNSSRPPDALARRYPRATAVGAGWALSYWDGTGASLVRIDAGGQVTGDALELRSGDERGGHTDARMTATERAIAVTWQVEPPRMNHGFDSEQPERPGPRVAILRCAR